MSDLVIHKYGGTSLANSDRMKRVARRIARLCGDGGKALVVVSAQGDATDRLIGLGLEMTARPDAREMDALMATGEQSSAALASMALSACGVRAVSLAGWQAGIRTDDRFGAATIRAIDPAPIRARLEERDCVVVAGFQGATEAGEITTLGRGGSDTTAVALAAAFGARTVDIFTDVDGVFTADPRHVPTARKLADISYDEIIELSTEGARVLDSRAVTLGKMYDVEIHKRSSFHDEPGTIIRKETVMEKRDVRGVTCRQNISKVTLAGVPKRPGALHRIFERIAQLQVNVDAIIQTDTSGETTDVSFTLVREDLLKVVKVLQETGRELDVSDVQYEVDCAKVSVVGEGMRSRPGVAATIFEALAERDVDIHMISTSDIKISVLVDLDRAQEAVRAIHDKFGLGLPAAAGGAAVATGAGAGA